jgi:hypothetical protein
MKIQNTLLFGVTFLLVLLLQPSCTVLAQSDVAAAARANRARAGSGKADSEWYKPTRASLSAQDRGVALTILYEISSNQDMKITIDTTEKGRQQSEIMLVSGQCQWMLTKGMPLEKGYEIDALDVPVLNFKLALELLRAAAPGGPREIKKKTTFNVQEDRRSIAVNTASASGGLEAPWTLQATIEPTTADQWSFELSVKHKETIHFSGTWQKEATPPTFGDDLPLDGWQVLSIGPIKTTDENGTILDYGAQISKKHPKTLGELRKITVN